MCPSQLTHAESVRVGHAGSDLHLTVRALGAGLARCGDPLFLRKCSGPTYFALGVSLWAALPDNTLTAGAHGTRRAQALGPPKEVATVAFALRVLSGGAKGQRGEAERTPGAG